MADEKPTSNTFSSPKSVAAPPPEVTKEARDINSVVEEPKASSFEADAFLTGKQPEQVLPLKPEPMKPATSTVEPTKSSISDTRLPPPSPSPTILKRGGVGFMTALLMSVFATAGGAYLALFAQSRPDLLKQAGIASIIPQAVVPSVGIDGANLAPLETRISAIETELMALKTRLDGGVSAPASPINQTPSSPTDNVSGKANAQSAPNNVPAAPMAPAPASANLADIGVMKGELAGISGRVTAIETRIAALDPTGAGGAVIAGLQADIATLKSVIGSLQEQVATAPSPAITFAIINLAEAANRSAPFMVELDTLRAAMPSAPEVVALEPFARTGIPTRQMLQERFAALAPAVSASGAADAEGKGFLAWIGSFFSDMVKIQPAPNASGASSGAVLLRAKTKLDQGDMSGSADELASIVGPPPNVTEWVNNARKRIELESRVSAVRGAAARATSAPTPNIGLPDNKEPAAQIQAIPSKAPALPPPPSRLNDAPQAPATKQGSNP